MAEVLNLNILGIRPHVIILLDRALDQIDWELAPEVFVSFLGFEHRPDVLQALLVDLEYSHLLLHRRADSKVPSVLAPR